MLLTSLGNTTNPNGRKTKMKLVITGSEAINIIRNTVKGTTIISVDLDSDMDGKGKMRVTNNPFAGLGIVKRETLTGIVGYDYGAAVNRVAAKEGAEDRQAKQHPWGDMDDQRLFRIHRKTGKHYLSMMVRGVTVHGFFRPDGSQVDETEIRMFIPEKTKSSTQADLEQEVIARDYNLDNIRAMRFAGSEWELIPDGAVQSVTIPAVKTPASVPVMA